MIVYFSGSARDISEKSDLYSNILGGVHEAGGIIAQSWVPVMLLRGGLPTEIEWWESLSGEANKGIEDADLVIVEASGPSAFGVGYELAFALYHKKNTLLLIEKGKENCSYAIGIKHQLLTKRIYKMNLVAKDVSNFIRALEK